MNGLSLARALRLLQALALLAAWQSALVHPVEHVDRAGGLVHVPGHSDGKGGGASLSCDAVGATAACIAGSPVLADPFSGRHARLAVDDAGGPGAPSHLAYRSQAPPRVS